MASQGFRTTKDYREFFLLVVLAYMIVFLTQSSPSEFKAI